MAIGHRPLEKGLLLYFDLAASIFQLLLRGIGLGLVSAFEHRLGRTLDQSLSFRQAKPSFNFAHGLDDCNLLVSRHGDENDVKLRLGLGSRRSCATPGSRSSSRNRCRSRNAPFGFQFFYELGDFNHRRITQVFYDLSFI